MVVRAAAERMGPKMPDDLGGASRQTGTPAEAAAYVAELAGDLASIARRHGLDALSYILDMAKLEAENVSRFSNGRH
jgi:hypothetical protein